MKFVYLNLICIWRFSELVVGQKGRCFLSSPGITCRPWPLLPLVLALEVFQKFSKKICQWKCILWIKKKVLTQSVSLVVYYLIFCIKKLRPHKVMWWLPLPLLYHKLGCDPFNLWSCMVSELHPCSKPGGRWFKSAPSPRSSNFCFFSNPN